MESPQWTMTGCLILILLLLNCACQEMTNLTFPASFLFGAASSAYQVEGAWNESGKGQSTWDYLVHNTRMIADGSTGDVSADSYHRYREDIAALKELGVNFYRFSISWPRILPTGFRNKVNAAAIEYYNKLIDSLLAEGIEPWVTMYHFDLPLPLYNLGGWHNSKIADYMRDYADVLFQLFGDRVKIWLTINEPLLLCFYHVTMGINVRGAGDVPTGITEYLCGHNVLRAHAKIYRLYERKYKRTQRGRISLVSLTQFPLPGSDSAADAAAAQRKRDFELGWFLHPLVYGDYPQSMIDIIANNSALQGYPVSRLPEFTPLEKFQIKGTYDFIALNHYSSELVVFSNNSDVGEPSLDNDDGVDTYQDLSWENSTVNLIKVVPRGFRELLLYIKETYGNPEIVITEQGYPDEPNTLNDTRRINYYQLYLNEALMAIHEDGVKLTAYTAWSLMDSFEWISGYSVRFGLYHIDFGDENRTRTPKESAIFYKNLIATRCLIDICI